MTAAADRHLLFALVALQNGIINQEQLLAAFRAWTPDKACALRQAPKALPIKVVPRFDDGDFASLRRYGDFPLILMDAAMPPDAFAGPRR
jgi:hypothetical protein